MKAFLSRERRLWLVALLPVTIALRAELAAFSAYFQGAVAVIGPYNSSVGLPGERG